MCVCVLGGAAAQLRVNIAPDAHHSTVYKGLSGRFEVLRESAPNLAT